MKNKNQIRKAFFLFMVLACITPILQAQYTLTKDDVTIEYGTIVESHSWPSDWGTTDLIIPDSIDGQLITGIGDDMFDQYGITSVKFGNEITFIGVWAFSENALKVLELPKNIKTIGREAFYDNQIQKVLFPKSIVSVGDLCFGKNPVNEIQFEENCQLRSVGTSITKEVIWYKLPTNNNNGFIGYYDKYGKKYKSGEKVNTSTSGGYSTIYADMLSHTLTAEDVIMQDGEIYRFEVYPEITIPAIIGTDTVKSIGAKAFVGNVAKSIIINEGIKGIMEGAFYFSDINQLYLPTTITRIEPYSFQFSRINSLYLPNSINYIGDYAFDSNELDTLILPKSLEYIGKEAFHGHNLSFIELPNSIAYIGKDAFSSNSYNFTGLDTIYLPNPVIKEGFLFSHWENESHQKDEIINGWEEMRLSYEAKFTSTKAYIVKGEVDVPDFVGVLLNLTGDFEGVRNLNDDGTFEFPLNAGRTITITPYHEGYLFFPESVHIDSIKADTGGFYFNCSIKDFDINFSANEFGTVRGETYQNRAYKEQTSMVTAMPNEGCVFIEWTDENGATISIEDSLIITVKQDMNITALFDKVEGVKNTTYSEVVFYPNPTKNRITIEASEIIEKIELYDSQGKLIYKQQYINKTLISLPLAKYLKGIGFLSVSGKGFSKVVKVFVE